MMKRRCLWLFQVVVLHSVLCNINGLPPEWTNLISKLCSHFDDDHPSSPTVINDFHCIVTWTELEDLVHTSLAFLLPPVILYGLHWNSFED